MQVGGKDLIAQADWIEPEQHALLLDVKESLRKILGAYAIEPALFATSVELATMIGSVVDFEPLMRRHVRCQASLSLRAILRRAIA